MCPYFHVFGLTVPAYGIMMLFGMAVALGIVFIRCVGFDFPRSEAILAALIGIAGGVTGSVLLRPIIRLPELIINWDKYTKIPLSEFLPWFFGELVFYGGLIGGVVALILYCRGFKLSFLRLTDIIAPALPVGHAFGRVGCLFAGCCYGIEVSPLNPLAIIYPQRTDGLEALTAPAGTPLLALPLIEACGNIFIACIIMLFQRKNKTAGLGVAVYGILYSVFRFTLEFFRGDTLRGVYSGVSTSQIISMVIFAVSILWLIYVTRKSRLAAS